MQISQSDQVSRIAQEIEALCLKKLSIHIPARDQDLFETGVLDSLSLVQLILELEQHFQIELPMGELDISALRSIDEMARLIDRRKAPAAEANAPPALVNSAR